MNWLLLAVAVFLLLAAWDGYRKGFIKKLVAIVSLVLTLVLTYIASPFVAEFLRESTGLYSTLQNSIEASDAELLEMMQGLGLGDAVSGYLAEQILQALAFLLTLILVGVLIRGIVFSLGIAARLPILRGINKLAGLVFGFGEGLVIVWIFFFVITVFATTDWGRNLMSMVWKSDMLTWLYKENILFKLL